MNWKSSTSSSERNETSESRCSPWPSISFRVGGRRVDEAALIVIGNGMAAARMVEELAKRALGRYAVAVIGDEPRLAYNRVLLSALLAEEVGFADIELKPARWWRDRGVTLRYGVRASAVDPTA